MHQYCIASGFRQSYILQIHVHQNQRVVLTSVVFLFLPFVIVFCCVFLMQKTCVVWVSTLDTVGKWFYLVASVVSSWEEVVKDCMMWFL